MKSLPTTQWSTGIEGVDNQRRNRQVKHEEAEHGNDGEAGCARTLNVLATLHLGFAHVANINDERQHDDDHQGDRNRGSQRPVASRTEL